MLVTNGFLVFKRICIDFYYIQTLIYSPYSSRKYSNEINMHLLETKFGFKRTTL